MMPDFMAKLLLIAGIIMIAACDDGDFQDLDDFIAEIKSRPADSIKPIPTFNVYKAFTYNAAALRSPFDRPMDVVEITQLPMASEVSPDSNRTKEYLEQFTLDALSMVGTLEQNNVLWALVQDQHGAIHRVKPGNYMGRNYGRIIESSKTHITVIEIVSNGVNGWIERPITIRLKVLDE